LEPNKLLKERVIHISSRIYSYIFLLRWLSTGTPKRDVLAAEASQKSR
jgi:hypothetical protein